MTKLSVNLNKIALLRNSRGRDFPNVVVFAEKIIALGVQSITIHPRQDERHITKCDAIELGELLSGCPEVELNIEGYPSQDFMALVAKSDHGWDLKKNASFIKNICNQLMAEKIRSSIFIDPCLSQIKLAKDTGADRIELYTEEYASTFSKPEHEAVFNKYKNSAVEAKKLGVGVNAGHDLDLANLPKFLTIGGILEVSIGHVLTVECIEYGMKSVVGKYLKICGSSN